VSTPTTRSPEVADVAIVGFGFSGLATLINLARSARRLRIVIVASDASGHGLAYGTTSPFHRLNVVSEKMGARADDEQDFVAWLRTDAADDACKRLNVRLPAPDDFAPRPLFARYLDDLRDAALRQLEERGTGVSWMHGRATSISPAARGWRITTTEGELVARSCVLAVGNQPRHVFGDLRHPALHDGPWKLTRSQIPRDRDRVVLIGSGLTAVDAILSLRALGFGGEVLALSRHGQLPQSHDPKLVPVEIDPSALVDVRTLAEVVSFVSSIRAAGVDWRAVIDGLRPYTVATWQGFSTEDQQTVIERWASIWSVYRHRMAPDVAARIQHELANGSLRVVTSKRISPIVVDGRLELEIETEAGIVTRLEASAVIDCTGPQLDPSECEEPLLPGLIRDGICQRHQTGLGLSAGPDQQVANRLYGIGSLLTGELWETIAVPELREQAAVIAAAIADTRQA
jgi:uncharacterized NAD(P)/FAD-binding protein YdhS